MASNPTRRDFLIGTAASCALTYTPVARAEGYPTKQLHLLVGEPAGSTPDIVGRLVGDQLASALGKPVVVENRAGPGGIAAMQALASSTADGHTIALATVNQLVFNSYLFAKLPYDPLTDIEPISLLATNSFSIAVKASFVDNFDAFVKAAKAQPGRLSVGTSLPGTAPHVFAHVLMRIIGIEVAFVPYRSGTEGLTGLIRGDVDMLLDSPAVMVPHVKEGSIKVLATTGRGREPQLPDVPTFRQIGFPVAEYESWFGLVAPAGTSSDTVTRLHRTAAAAVTNPGIRQRFATLSFEPQGTSPEDFRKLIREEHTRWGSLIRDAGIRLD
jgi:tripartite-type tricarboxylate transporter receptor subunit TctC